MTIVFPLCRFIASPLWGLWREIKDSEPVLKIDRSRSLRLTTPCLIGIAKDGFS